MTAAHHRRAAHVLAGALALATAIYALDTMRDLGPLVGGWFYNVA